MSKDVFKMKDIGVGLHGVIKIAMGDKAEGLDILKAYINEEEKEGIGKMKNLKMERFRA
jgi:hypothetical protein